MSFRRKLTVKKHITFLCAFLPFLHFQRIQKFQLSLACKICLRSNRLNTPAKFTPTASRKAGRCGVSPQRWRMPKSLVHRVLDLHSPPVLYATLPKLANVLYWELGARGRLPPPCLCLWRHKTVSCKFTPNASLYHLLAAYAFHFFVRVWSKQHI